MSPMRVSRALMGLAFSLIIGTASTVRAVGLDLFHPYQFIPMNSKPAVVAVGDVNSDSRNDVIVSTSFYFSDDDFHIHVFYQDESGVLLPPLKLAGGTGQTIAIADLNDDGRNDVAVSTPDGIGVFWQASDGSLDPMEHFSDFHFPKIAACDFNHDGLRDLAGLDPNSSSVVVLLQGTNGAWSAVSSVDPFLLVRDLECADLTNDGRDDIVAIASSYPLATLHVFPQNAAGGFDPYETIEFDTDGWGIDGITTGDFNGDNLRDVAATVGGNRPASRTAIVLQDASGGFKPADLMPSLDIPIQIKRADFNFDGLDDIAVGHGHFGAVGIYVQTEDGNLMPEEHYPILYTQPFNPDAMDVGDFNGDGAPDIAFAGFFTTGLELLYGSVLPRVAIDLLPLSCPNIINTGAQDLDYRGIRPGAAAANRPMVPVAVVGSKTFDVSRIDPATIDILGVSPVSSRIADVSRPVEVRESECECTTAGPDGLDDLVLNFDQAELLAALGPVGDGEVRTLSLSGKTKTRVPLSGSDCVTIKDGPTRLSPIASVDQESHAGFVAYPNPFNAATVVSFSLSNGSDVRLEVFDILGRRVTTLADGFFPAGDHHLTWDGSGAASGVYFARLATADGVMTRKMVVVR